jgi:hypothetical protein
MPSEPTQHQIEKRAYELFHARGCEHGKDLEDWLIAEQELLKLILESNLAVQSETENLRRRNLTTVSAAVAS